MAKPQTEKGTDYVFGAKVEFGEFTLDSTTVSAVSEMQTTVAFSGVTTEGQDLVFVSPRSLDGYLVAKGAEVTDTDEVGVTLANYGDTDQDPSSVTLDYMVYKFNDS